MTYRIKGTLKLPDGAPAANCEIEFVSLKNFSPLVQGAKTNIMTSATGAYDVTLELGEYAVILYTGGTYPAQAGTITLSADTTPGLDLPSLLNRSDWVPATPEYMQQIEAWLVSAGEYAASAEASAQSAADSAASTAGAISAHEAKAEAHSIAGVSGLQAALNGKEDAGAAASLISAHKTESNAHAIEKITGLRGELDSLSGGLGSSGVVSHEALRRSYAEAGLNLVDGSFEEGGTLTSSIDVLLHKASGIAYSGPIGQVAAGTDPTLTGSWYVPRTDALLRNELASEAGASLVGEAAGGTIQDTINAITGRYAYIGKSIVDILSEPEIARLLSNDNAFDLTTKIQSLIDEKKPFYLLPNVRHYCNGSLQMKSGAKIMAAGDGVNQQPGNAWTVETAIVFNQATTSLGIKLSSSSGWVTEWAVDGVTLDTIDNTASIGTFTMFDVDSSHNGCYNFKLHCYVRGAKFGLNVDSDFWNGDLDIRFAYCYRPFVRSANGYSTSLSGWVKTSFCFHGVEIHQATYCPLNFWFDQCGKNAPAYVIASAPATELPVLMYIRNSVGISGTVGVEKSNAQFINASSYSSIEYSVHYFAGISDVFVKDEIRISNVPILNQGVIYANNSQVALKSMVVSHLIANGYPAASTSSPTYFVIPDGSDDPRVIFDGCFLNMQEYCVCPATTEKYISAQSDRNGSFRFGASSVNAPRQSIDWVDDYLRFGTKTDKGYHQMHRNVAFVDGDICTTIQGASGASTLQFKAVNGDNGSATSSALRIPASSVTSRSINAGGTVNASGADYAEYMTKAEDCGVIQKGDICGVTANCELTDKYDHAIAFVIKSTNPAYVGGDAWFNDESPERDLDELEDEFEKRISDYTARMESARKSVDRVAFCGQVPCNIVGAKPGDYIVPARNFDGSIGCVVISSPTIDDYMTAVGRVWKILPDGRAWVSVKIA